MARFHFGLIALLLLTAWAYATLRSATFVYEDYNPQLSLDLQAERDNRGPWQGWHAELHAVRFFPRGLTNVTMRLQGGHSAAAYHLANVGLHLVNGTLLYALIWPMGPIAAIWTALLFLLLPLAHEAVSYVSARTDLLMTLCVLLMLLATQARRPWDIPLVMLSAAGAVWAKESGAVAVLLLPLWLRYQGQSWRRWRVPAVCALAALGWIGIGFIRGGSVEGVRVWHAVSLYTSPAPHGPIWYAAVQAAAVCRLIGLFFMPDGFSIDHDWELVSPWLAGLAVFAVGLAVIVALRRFPSAWALAVLWVLLALLPRFIVAQPEYVHEQHMYLPLIGMCLAVGLGVQGRTEVWA